MRIRPPVLAQQRFAARRSEFAGLTLAERFETIWRTNLWGADTSRSGLGSEADATRALRDKLQTLLRDLDITTLLDLPCSDYGWIDAADLDLTAYVGGDIVRALIDDHQTRFATPDGRIAFRHLDLCSDALPMMDAVLCRDCLVHLSFANIARALDNIRRSGCRYLIATTFPDHGENQDIEDGDWRLLNMALAPFALGPPLVLLNEDCRESSGAYDDKALGVWRSTRRPELRARYALEPMAPRRDVAPRPL